MYIEHVGLCNRKPYIAFNQPSIRCCHEAGCIFCVLLILAKVSADRSEDNSSNSSNSQLNSEQTSPEHQIDSEKASPEEGDNSTLTVEVNAGETNPVTFSLGDSKNSNSAIAGEHESDNGTTANGVNGADIEINNINGAMNGSHTKASPAVTENGASLLQNGQSTQHTNGSADKR